MLNIRQVQFAHRRTGQPRLTQLQILGDHKRNEDSAWHMHFICSGIKYCEFHHPEILQELPRYSQVDVEHIDGLRKRLQHAERKLPAIERVLRATEAYAKYILGLCTS